MTEASKRHSDPREFAQWVVEHRAVCGVGEQNLAEAYLSFFEQFEELDDALRSILDITSGWSRNMTTEERVYHINEIAERAIKRVSNPAKGPAQDLPEDWKHDVEVRRAAEETVARWLSEPKSE